MPQIYRRYESAENARKIELSGELWGRPPRNYQQSDFPKVKAYCGPLREGEKGIEFITEVEPDKGSPRGQALWSESKNGVIIEGDWAKIKIKVTRNTT